MLTIRRTQMSALLEARIPDLSLELAHYLRLEHADAVAGLDDAVLHERVVVGVRRARAWGIDSMFGFALFVALMFEIAPDFDRHPGIRAWLDDSSRPLDERLETLGAALDDDAWDRLAADGDPSAWSP